MDASVPESELLSALAAGGIKTVISESTEPVLVSNWAETEMMPLGEVLERLVTGDPRRDRYIESLGAWFSATVGGKPYRAYYIPAFSPLFPEKALEKALSSYSGRYLLPDAVVAAPLSLARRLGYTAFALTFMIGTALLGSLGRAKETRSLSLPRLALRLVVALPWVVIAARGLPMAGLAVLWGIALIDAAQGLDLPMEEYVRSGSLSSAFDSLRRQPGPPFVVALSAIGAVVLVPSALAASALALLSSLLATAVFALLASIKRDSRSLSRPKFVPKPIAARRRSRRSEGPWPAALAFAAITLWAAASFTSSRGDVASAGDAVFPRPLKISGSARPGPAESGERTSTAGQDRLPDLAAWLEHVAIQEALPLERVGEKRADPFAPVAISRSGGEALALRFDEEWARAAYRSLPQASVEGMLAAQGASVASVFKGGGEKGRPLAPIDALRYIFLLIPPLGGIAASLLASRGSPSSRARQEA